MKTAPVKSYNLVKFLENGTRFELNGKSIVYSDIPLKNRGNYKYLLKIKINKWTGGCLVFGLENENTKDSSEYWGQYPATCICCKSLDAVHVFLQKGLYLGNFFKPGCIFKV